MREAVLLVGGQGTRLRPLTLTTPKPLLPVAGVPFLAHQLAGLRQAGVDHVVLATSYRAEIFQETFGDGTPLGLRLTYLHENEPLGTGGAIRNAAEGLQSQTDEPVVILNGDVLSGHDLAAQVDAHLAVGADVTLHLVEVADARAYGCVPTDDDGRVTAFLEKMEHPVSSWINAGAYVFRRSVIDAIPAGKVVSVERDTFPDLLAAGRRVQAWKETAYWCDVGTPEALVRCSADVVLGVAPSAAQRLAPALAWFADGYRPPSDVRVIGGSTVLAGSAIESGAVVDASIVMSGALIGADAQVTRSIIGSGAVVGSGSVVVESAVADTAVVPPGTHLAPGSRVEATG
ncbi:MAG: NDP-sugar synthase [Actinomycetes bacterium]